MSTFMNSPQEGINARFYGYIKLTLLFVVTETTLYAVKLVLFIDVFLLAMK